MFLWTSTHILYLICAGLTFGCIAKMWKMARAAEGARMGVGLCAQCVSVGRYTRGSLTCGVQLCSLVCAPLELLLASRTVVARRGVRTAVVVHTTWLSSRRLRVTKGDKSQRGTRAARARRPYSDGCVHKLRPRSGAS